ncbi:hypothetical protein BB558_006928 [Smittium angustum]|uniref:J domain-containing protein n=1 Tax=Smittium angustum TaxID=133377 RepID=A0A2U1IWL6_SMIAN|nr:hypothetical protein BB558_006928 [Smittium angustum]
MSNAKVGGNTLMTQQERELDLYFKQQITQVSRSEEVERILNLSKLDPFTILNVSNNCTANEVKNAYRKKSILIHPDKTSHPQAREAFEKLKRAEQDLTDEKQRKWLKNMLEEARQVLLSEQIAQTLPGKKRERSVEEGILEKDPEFEKKVRVKFRELVIEMEWRRLKKAKLIVEQKQNEADKQKQEQAEKETEKKKEKEWASTRDDRINSWRNFQTKNKKKNTKNSSSTKKSNFVQDPNKPYIKRKI